MKYLHVHYISKDYGRDWQPEFRHIDNDKLALYIAEKMVGKFYNPAEDDS